MRKYLNSRVDLLRRRIGAPLKVASMVMVAILLLCGGCSRSVSTSEQAGKAESVARTLPEFSISGLENRITEIDRQLEALCPMSFHSGYGVEGRSALHATSDQVEWFEIELDEPTTIDQVVLVPAIWRDAKYGLQADGFPLDFKVLVGNAGESAGQVVASFTEASGLLPRTAPLVIPCDAVTGSWVRIEATRLTPRIWDSQYTFKLSEILIFSGMENVALHRKLTASGQPLRSESLVDGFVPLFMDGKTEGRSVAYMKVVNSNDEDFQPQPEFTLDLKSVQAVDQINLHALELSSSAPRSLGFPRKFLLDVSNEPDFSDAVTVLETESNLGNRISPIAMFGFPETECRYVRLRAVEPDVYVESNRTRYCIGFAEIELFFNGQNVSQGASVETNFPANVPNRPLSALTDGMNFYGEIIPLRDWLNELAWRHDLSAEKPVLVAELNRRFALHSARFKWMSGLAAILAVAIGLTVVMNRFVRASQLNAMKERFAADLHDELGANIQVIGILSDLAQDACDSPEKLKGIHERIREMTERSGQAVQNCINISDDALLHHDLYEDMKRTTKRIMADIPGDLTLEGGKRFLETLHLRKRADLFLFYKECLVNISRHSEATEFSARLSADEKTVSLIVTDNGIGMGNTYQGGVARSLLRRARLLGADVEARQPTAGGTEVVLQLRTQQWWPLKSLSLIRNVWPVRHWWPLGNQETSCEA